MAEVDRMRVRELQEESERFDRFADFCDDLLVAVLDRVIAARHAASLGPEAALERFIDLANEADNALSVLQEFGTEAYHGK